MQPDVGPPPFRRVRQAHRKQAQGPEHACGEPVEPVEGLVGGPFPTIVGLPLAGMPFPQWRGVKRPPYKPGDKPLDTLGALSLSKRRRPYTPFGGLRHHSQGAVRLHESGLARISRCHRHHGNRWLKNDRSGGEDCEICGLVLRMTHRFAAAHGAAGFRGGCLAPADDLLHELDHGIKEDVSLPQALKAGRPVGRAIEITAELGDQDDGFTQAEFFFDARISSTSHSHGLNSTSQGSPGTVRPRRASSMIRQAITASRAMARSRDRASRF